MQNNVLGIAARYNDARAEEIPLPDMLKEMGLTWEDVSYIADQRAIRVVAVTSQRRELKMLLLGNKDEPVRVPKFTPTEMISFNAAKLAIIDGLVIGWRAKGIDQ